MSFCSLSLYCTHSMLWGWLCAPEEKREQHKLVTWSARENTLSMCNGSSLNCGSSDDQANGSSLGLFHHWDTSWILAHEFMNVDTDILSRVKEVERKRGRKRERERETVYTSTFSHGTWLIVSLSLSSSLLLQLSFLSLHTRYTCNHNSYLNQCT